MLHIVKTKTIDTYAYLIEELGYIEVENQISNPIEVDSEDPMIIVDTKSKTLFQIDESGLAIYADAEIKLIETTLKEIKSWEK